MSKFSVSSANGGTPSVGISPPGIGKSAEVFQWSFSKNGWYELLKFDKVVEYAAQLARMLGENTLHLLLLFFGVCLFIFILSVIFKYLKERRVKYIKKHKYGATS